MELNFGLPQQIAKAQRSGGLQGRHQQSHTSSVVFTLQTKLASMTNNFKEVCFLFAFIYSCTTMRITPVLP